MFRAETRWFPQEMNPKRKAERSERQARSPRVKFRSKRRGTTRVFSGPPMSWGLPLAQRMGAEDAPNN
jgi:hypothetical protein